jgi:hypothetical protein
LLSSSGLRYGSLPALKLRDLEKNDEYNIYKIIAYRKGKKFKYHTFCSPECSTLIDSYLEYRKNQGEQLNSNSPLIREQFNTNDKLKINNPRHLTRLTLLVNIYLLIYTNNFTKHYGLFNYRNYNSMKDIWDADEKAKDIRNYTTPKQTLESLHHIMKRYLKLKGFNIDSHKSSSNNIIDDDVLLKTLCFDTEFQKFAEEKYAFYIKYDKVKKMFIFDKFKID